MWVMNECMNLKLRGEVWTEDALRSHHIRTGLKIMSRDADMARKGGRRCGGGIPEPR